MQILSFIAPAAHTLILPHSLVQPENSVKLQTNEESIIPTDRLMMSRTAASHNRPHFYDNCYLILHGLGCKALAAAQLNDVHVTAIDIGDHVVHQLLKNASLTAGYSANQSSP
jgi:hypothetical protein